MVVKSKVGRKRYIIFKIEGNFPISKGDLISTLKMAIANSRYKINRTVLDHNNSNTSIFFNRMPWLIFTQNNYGLLRCHHLDLKKTIDILQSISSTARNNLPIKITTLGTTGTIRSARKKYLDKLYVYPLNNIYRKRV